MLAEASLVPAIVSKPVWDHELLVGAEMTGGLGGVVSITIDLFPAMDPAAPGEGSVKIALLPAVSVMVEPLKDNDDVET